MSDRDDDREPDRNWAVMPCPFVLPESRRPCQLTSRHTGDHFAVWQDAKGAALVESAPRLLTP